MSTVDLSLLLAADHPSPLTLTSPIITGSGWYDQRDRTPPFTTVLSRRAIGQRRSQTSFGWIETASGVVLDPHASAIGSRDLIGELRASSATSLTMIAAVNHDVPDIGGLTATIGDSGLASAIELDVRGLDPDRVGDLLDSLGGEVAAPVFVRIGADPELEAIVNVIEQSMASALVADGAPPATVLDTHGQRCHGRLHGHAVLPLTLDMVDVMTRSSRKPVIAAGGIFSADDLMNVVRCGAVAAEVDLLLAIHPARAAGLGAALAAKLGSVGFRSWSEFLDAAKPR